MIYHSHTATPAFPSRTDVGLAAEPDAHYVLVSTAEYGNSPGPVEFRSFRIVNGVVTEEEVEVISSTFSAPRIATTTTICRARGRPAKSPH